MPTRLLVSMTIACLRPSPEVTENVSAPAHRKCVGAYDSASRSADGGMVGCKWQ